MQSWESFVSKDFGSRVYKGLFTLYDLYETLQAAKKFQEQKTDDEEILKELQKAEKQFEETEEDWSEAERERKQKERKLKELQETNETLALHKLLPELLHRGNFKEAEEAVCDFLDRNPHNADGFVLLAEVSAYRNNPIGAMAALWGAIYNCSGNRRLQRLLVQYEESFLMEKCELPLQFKVKALEVPQEEAEGQKEKKGFIRPDFGMASAPLMILRHGCHTAAFVNKAMSPGDLVFKERPFVCTPLLMDGQIFSSCFHCLQEREDPERAFACPVSPHTCPFVFCSWKCLMRNGRLHSVECKSIPTIYGLAKESGLNVTAVLHVFRTLVKAALQREINPPKEGPSDSDINTDIASLLLSLNSYDQAVKQGQPELYKCLTILVRRLQRILPPSLLLFLNEKELIHFILVVLEYSPFVTATSAAAAVERKNPECTLGRVLAPATTTLHHSCVPTATICLQEDGQVAVRALTFIPSGGCVCVSVEEDLFKPQKERKAIVGSPRVFGCGCVRCTDKLEGGRLLRGIRCNKCIRGFFCPTKGAAMLARLKAYGETGVLTGLLAADPNPLETAAKATSKKESGAKLSKKKTRRAKKVPGSKTPANEDEAEASADEANSKAPDSKKQPKKEGEQQENAAHLEEQWLCNSCGLASEEVSEFCAALEKDISELQTQAEGYLVKGAHARATKAYTGIIERYGSRLHPQHNVLFNAHIVLAGLLASHGQRNIPLALILLRRAAVVAETVLPPTSMTKVHLYLKLAELTYEAMQLEKQCRRGVSLPPEKIMEPLFSALWNCTACMGSEASLSVAIGLRLRRFAALLGVCTAPIMHVPVVRTEDVFVGLYRAATNSPTATPEQIMAHFKKDPMFVAVALVRHGRCFPLALELFRAMMGVVHLPTGLNLLGLACLHSQDAVVRELLAMGYDLFAKSHLGMTPLLVMCAARESRLPSDRREGPKPHWSDARAAKETEEAQLRIFRLMLQHCEAEDERRKEKKNELPVEKAFAKPFLRMTALTMDRENSDGKQAFPKLKRSSFKSLSLKRKQEAKGKTSSEAKGKTPSDTPPPKAAEAKGAPSPEAKENAEKSVSSKASSPEPKDAKESPPAEAKADATEKAAAESPVPGKAEEKGKEGSPSKAKEESSSGSRQEPLSAMLGPSRRRLLFACAHRFLGQSYALHFAASNGKARLCRQLLAAGSIVGVHNAESATPLHLASMAGDVETVKVLLRNGADINAATLRGETPLLLAAYWLHEEIVLLLLEQGADCSVVTRATGMNILHAVAAGVLRQTKALYRGLAWEGDPAAVTLEGFSVETAARGTYTNGQTPLSTENRLIDLRLPSSVLEDNDLFLFAGELMERTKKAQRLLLSLMSYCPHTMYTQHTRSGLAAADLLEHSWENFHNKRRKILQHGNLRFNLTADEKRNVEEQWHFVVHQIYLLRDMLRPNQFTMTEAAAGAEPLTPREAELKEEQHQNLLAQAPWYFREEVINAITKRNNVTPAETAAKG